MINPNVFGKDPSGRAGEGGSYPLLCHLLDTAVVAGILWDTRVRPRLRARVSEVLGVEDEIARQVIMLAAGLHDVGKANPFFQYQERSGANGGFADELQERLGLPTTPGRLKEILNAIPVHPLRRHEFISHRIVTGGWAWSDDAVRGNSWLGVLLAGHHGYWRATTVNAMHIGDDPRSDGLTSGWSEQQDELVARVEEVIGLGRVEVPALAGPGALVPFTVFSGLLTLADWLASDDELVARGKKLWLAREPHASLRASQDWMDERTVEFAGHIHRALGPAAEVSRDGLSAAVMADYTPRPLQAEALGFEEDEADPGLWICMYPTGDGKTEAALLRGAVDPDEGFIFGLPTLATTDAMESRLLAYAARLPETETLPLIKSHGFADLARRLADAGEDSAGACGSSSSWYSAAIRKLVAPNVVATVDQVLVGALSRKHVTLRLFGLANHHVILDEVHTYDEYQTELLIELLYWWGATRTRVTLLSATLPSAHMRLMVQAYKAGVRNVSFDSLSVEVATLTSVFPSTVHVSAVHGGHSVHEPRGDVREPQATVIDVPMTIHDRGARISSHVAWARDTAAAHPQSPIAIFTNVVADCAHIAAQLRGDTRVTATHEVLCLHSALVTGHRRATERRLVDRAGRAAHALGFSADAKPVLVVGTQTIQASLDFDVDFAASDLAPAPDLIQRLGRAWRFEGTPGTGSFRGGRIPVGTGRTLRVLPVVDEAGETTWLGDLPYLSAVLGRTLDALRSQVARSPWVDVFSFSQSWVDAAYDKDPSALLSTREATVTAATRELVEGLKRVNESRRSRAPLARRNAEGSTPLLPGDARPEWTDLVLLTRRPDDDALMQTRYVEQQTRTVILTDTSGETTYWDAQSGETVEFPSMTASELGRIGTHDALGLLHDFSIGVPMALADVVDQAISQGGGGHAWDPVSTVLLRTPPVDLALLRDHAVYHPVSGLMKKESR